MKRLLWLAAFSAALALGQDLSKVQSVYLLPMSRGMDQYLANWLTQDHVFQVVTNPKLADAVFTDRIGEGFEAKLADAQPNTEADGASARKESEKEEPAKKEASPKRDSSKETTGPLLGNPVNKLPAVTSNSSWGRSQGTVFLVDPKSHRVLWSAYRPPKGSGSDELNRTASDIVSRLRRDLKLK